MTRRGGSRGTRRRGGSGVSGGGSDQPAASADSAMCPKAWSWSIHGFLGLSVLGFFIFAVAEGLYHAHHALAAACGALAVGVAVPLTHALGSVRYPREWRHVGAFHGSLRFQVFQGLGWFFFAAALATGLAPLASQSAISSGLVTMEGLGLGAHLHSGWLRLPGGVTFMAGAAGVIAEVLIVSSLLTFSDASLAPEGAAPLPGIATGRKPRSGSRSGTAGAGAHMGAGAGRALLGAGIVVGYDPLINANLLLAGVGAALAAATLHVEYLEAAFDRHPVLIVLAATAMACLCIAVPLTHGLGGRLRHTPRGWSFWQPFRGGRRFVLLQGLGWTMFAGAIALFSTGLFRAATRRAGAGHLVALGGAAGLGAEALLVISLVCFRHRDFLEFAAPPSADVAAGAAPCGGGAAAARRMVGGEARRRGFMVSARACCCVLSIYAGQYVTITLVFVPPFLLPPAHVLSLYLALAAAYGWTYFGAPHKTGARYSPRLTTFMSRWMADAACGEWGWFGGVHLVKDSQASLEREKKYVFGYHPHGLCPATAAWIHHTDEWAELFGGVKPHCLVASVLLYVPVLRELLLISGVRDVGRASFRRALSEGGSVLVIPGGQAELVVDEKRHDRVTLYTRHKGFVREAIIAGAELVPMFCFGESRALVNAVRLPALQRWTYRTFGFPVPYIPAGWGAGFLPLPRPLPLAVVVGDPIAVAPPGGPPAGGPELEALVEAKVREYYGALEALYEAHKHDYGYGAASLVLSHH